MQNYGSVSVHLLTHSSKKTFFQVTMVPNSSYRIFSKLIILTYALFASAHQIYLFSEADYKGETRAIEVGNCTNLESSFRNRVSSINTTWYSCVQLYDELNCSGNSIKISIRVPSVSNLGNWHFDKKTQSLGTCHDPCVPSLGHNVTEQSDQSQSTLLTLYEYQNFKGKAYEIPVFDGCTRIPDPHIMRVTFRSMRVSKGRCVLIFTGNKDVFKYSKDCIVQSIESIPNVLEIRDDMPILNDLSYWGLFKEETIKAVSPCQCNYFSPEPPVVDDAKGQLIILFTGTYYRGEHISISLDHENCLDLSVSKFKFWEGAARSIYFNDGSCVALYKTHSCRGLPHRELRTHISDLSEYDLDMSIRSFRTCSSIVKNNLGSSVPFYIVPLVVTTLLIVILIGIVVLVAIIILIRRKNGDQNASLKEKLTEKEVEEFMKGLGLDVDVRKLEYSNEVIDNDGLGQVPESSKLSSDLLAQNQPYNDQLEICRNQLEFDHKRPIGSGQYGCVFKGIMKPPDDAEAVTVAIKTTKPTANIHGIRSLLKEVKAMMYVGQHPKIVTLIGCSTLNLREGELLVVLEYCAKGSLEKYMKENRPNFLNIVQKGKLNLESQQESSSFYKCFTFSPVIYQNYYEPSACSSITDAVENSATNMFNIHQLILWSIEVAEGMAYLASKRVIHGDLSARNILVTSNAVAKISDFGLSKKMYCYSQYTRNGEEPLPWRWLALESLKNLEFSTASDVWSYGILLWEIFTLGEQPYPGVPSLTNNFIVNLEQGLRPTIPPFATSDCYNIMATCWDEDAKRRPSFPRLLSSLQEMKDYYFPNMSS